MGTADQLREVTPEAAARSVDPLLTPEQVALRLSVSRAWVHDHSGRKSPRLPVIRLGDGGPGRKGLLRYRASDIDKFIEEMAARSRQRRYNGRTPPQLPR